MANVDFEPAGLSEEESALLSEEGVDLEALETPVEQEPGSERKPEGEQAGEQEEKPNPAETAPDGHVPLGALKEARETIKGLRNELGQYRSWQQQIADKLADQRAQGSSQQDQDAPAIPNEDDDPIGALKYLKEQLQRREQQEEQARQQEQQRTQEQQQFQQMFNAVDTEFSAAAQQDPSVNEAYEFARESYGRELDALGYAPQQKEQQLLNFVYGFAQNYAQVAAARGVSIGDYVKAIAGSRGWQQTKLQGQGEQGKVAETADDKINRQKQAMEAGKTLSGGGAGNGETTIQDLANMSGEELEKLAASDPELFAKFGA